MTSCVDSGLSRHPPAVARVEVDGVRQSRSTYASPEVGLQRQTRLTLSAAKSPATMWT